MTLGSTLDLLYLVVAIAVLWIAAMLTWLLCEAAFFMRKVNRTAKKIQSKVEWLEKTISGIGERLEHSAVAINALSKGGRMVADYIRERRAERDDEDESSWGKKKKKKR